MRLHRLDGAFAVCRLAPDAAVPSAPPAGGLWSVTRTAHELSVVCPVVDAPAGATVEAPWTAFAVEGPLAFTLTGVVSSLTAPLAGAGVGVFVISTYDTDVILVAAAQADAATRAWNAAGHTVDHTVL